MGSVQSTHKSHIGSSDIHMIFGLKNMCLIFAFHVPVRKRPTCGIPYFELAGGNSRETWPPLQFKVVSCVIYQDGCFSEFCDLRENLKRGPFVTRKVFYRVLRRHSGHFDTLERRCIIKMFSKFRVSKRRSSTTSDDDTPGLVLVSSTSVSESSKR
jgi:hypothetical protein